jgi:predicted Zn-dependent protease
MNLPSCLDDGLSRRRFLLLASGFGAAAVAGCATNPVTGQRQFMLVSEAQELDMDRKWAPHQISADYGAVQDVELNAYVSEVGSTLAARTHRPGMPYSFRVVNNVVVNGYAMPAGTVALARGLMLDMENEAQLAAVLGHELGHVNARHAAERMTNSLLVMGLLTGFTAYVAHEKEAYKDLAAGLGALGANLLLSRYSRDDEREADWLGMEYMTRVDYDPSGMVGLMDMFMNLRQANPGVVELLFSTHPMSRERYQAAVSRAADAYAGKGSRLERERYMDRTARLRAMRPAIEAMQQGQRSMMTKRFEEADGYFAEARKTVAGDYAALLLTAKCCLARRRYEDAVHYARAAADVYPAEAQARHVTAMAELSRGRPEPALAEFQAYEAALPGNPNTVFHQGLCYERMGKREQAAHWYGAYRQAAPAGEFSGYVEKRLTEWGYLAPPTQEGKDGTHG